MGVQKKVRAFAKTKRVIGQRDARLKKNQPAASSEPEKKKKPDGVIREIPQQSSALFFQYNTALVPPYSVLVDTNFLSHSIQRKLDLLPTRDPRWERLKCDHKGVYADDCLVDRVMKHKIYIVATNDRDLKRRYAKQDSWMIFRHVLIATRVRKIPGVPIMSVARAKYVIERLPDAPEK
ncbi:hypothetical protein LTR04_000929 [Oleoguttula sp. CCFEE 6159]|nr:hypothetical protein LTR04_000929 [Oleoguttula sp. CCFEE 6159]